MNVGDKVRDPYEGKDGRVISLYVDGRAGVDADYADVVYEGGVVEGMPVHLLVPLASVREDQQLWEDAVRRQLAARGADVARVETDAEGFGQDWAEYRTSGEPVLEFVDAVIDSLSPPTD